MLDAAAAAPGSDLGPEAEASRPPRLREVAGALTLAVAIVAGSALTTNRLTPSRPFYDQRAYVGMAYRAPWSGSPIAAPFAYRPGASLVARGVMRLSGLSADRAFAAVALAALVGYRSARALVKKVARG